MPRRGAPGGSEGGAGGASGSGIDYSTIDIGALGDGQRVKLSPMVVQALNLSAALYQPGPVRASLLGNTVADPYAPSTPAPRYTGISRNSPARQVPEFAQAREDALTQPARPTDYVSDSKITAWEAEVLMQRGKLYIDPATGQYRLTPDLVGEDRRNQVGADAVAAANAEDAAVRDPDALIYNDQLIDTRRYTGPTKSVTVIPNDDDINTVLLGGSEEEKRDLVNKYADVPGQVAAFDGDWSDPEQRGKWLVGNYPSLAVAAADANLSNAEVARVTNLALAHNTAKMIVETQSSVEARQIMDSVPVTQRALVADIATEMYARNETSRLQDQIALEAKPAWMRVTQEYAGKAIGGVVEALTWPVEQVLHQSRATVEATSSGGIWDNELVRAAAVPFRVAPGPITSVALMAASGGPQRMIDAWVATSHGSWDEEKLTAAGAQFSPWEVEVIRNVIDAKNVADDEAYFAVLDMYADDPQAMLLIQNSMDDVNRDERLADLVRTVWAARKDDLGTMVFNDIGADPTTTIGLGVVDLNPFEFGRDVLNVTSFVAMDPLLWTGGAGKAAQAARYGVKLLHAQDAAAAAKHLTKRVNMALPATTAKSRLWQRFNGSKNVQRYFNWYGGQLENIRGLEGMERTNAINTLISQSKKYMPPEALQSALAYGVKDTKTAYEWMQGAENVALIMRGQAAKRGNQMYIPHMSIAMRGLKATSLGLRGADYTKWVTAKAEDELALAFGKDFTDLPHEQQIARWIEIISDEEKALEIGSLLSDFNGARTKIGEAVSRLASDRTAVERVWWASSYGWSKKKAGNLFEDVRARTDRVSRRASRMPTYFDDGIVISDARDAAKVYEAARWAGVPRYWALMFKGAWVEMTPGQRRQAWAGLNRTFARAAGVDLVDPVNGLDDFLDSVVGLSKDQLYAPNSVENYAGLRTIAEKQIDDEWDAILDSHNTLRLEAERITSENATRAPLAADEVDRIAAETFGKTEVEKAQVWDEAQAELAEAQRASRELEEQLRIAEAVEPPAFDTPEFQRALDEALDYPTATAGQSGRSGATEAATLRELLNSFSIDAAPSRSVQGLRFNKVRNTDLWKSTTPEGAYDIRLVQGQYEVTFTPSQALADTGVGTWRSTASTKAEAFAVARNHAGVGKTTVPGAPGFSSLEAKMLERGYLPARWARYWKQGGKDSGAWPEEQGAAFYNLAPDELSNPDWTGILETAQRVSGGGRSLWIPIPWMHGRQGVLKNAERIAMSDQQQLIDNIYSQIDEAEAAVGRAEAEVSGLREVYGDTVPRGMEDLRAEVVALREADGTLLPQQPVPYVPPMPNRERAVEARLRELREKAGVTNPSFDKSGNSQAVFMGQATERLAMPNYAAFDHLRARTSYLGALLMRNPVGTAITDFWTFATLAGPRFAFRNGIEDLVFYSLTGGNLARYQEGRRIATAVREATERSDKQILAAQTKLSEAEEELVRLQNNVSTPEQIAKAKDRVSKAADHLSKMENKYGGRGAKLGVAKTISRNVADKLDEAVPGIQNFILPHLTKEEVGRAARLAEEGNREALAELVKVAYLRQSMPWVNGRDTEVIAEKLARNASESEFSARQLRILSDLDDFMDTTYGAQLMDEASETSRYLIDGTMPSHQVNGTVRIINGVSYRRVTYQPRYASSDVGDTPTLSQTRGLMAQLHFALNTDGPRGQRAMTLLPRYYRAAAAGDQVEMARIVQTLTDFVQKAPAHYNYMERLALANTNDLYNSNRAVMDTLLNTFTERSGEFNGRLYKALRVSKRPENVQLELGMDEALLDSSGPWKPFSLTRKNDKGETIPTVSTAALRRGEFGNPSTSLVLDSDGIWVRIGTTLDFRQEAWSAMGRSLARLTREPIFISNYLDQRMALRGLEGKLVEDGVPPAVARRHAADLATERALDLTLAYADNPNIRSQFAYSVRNVARFYRAQEDFVRRLVRTASNNPSFFYKALAIWEAVQQTGFVHEDQYGEQYFVYPASQAANELMARAGLWLTGNDASVADGLALVTTGKVQWLTPSLDPESWWPTLSSPISAVPVKLVTRSIPSIAWLEKELFGSVGLNKGILEGAVPPIITRGIGVASSMLSSNEGGVESWGTTVGASTARRVALALAASGNYDLKDMNEEERRRFKRDADIAASSLLVGQMLLGMTLPSSPQISPGEINSLARGLGITGFRPAFIAELQHAGKDATFDEFAIKWIERNPGKAIYTISESTNAGRGYWETVDTVDKYLEDNEELVKENAYGASFFSPVAGIENVRTYNLLVGQGLKVKKSTLDYVNDLVEAEGQNMLILEQANYEQIWLSIDPEAENASALYSALNTAYAQRKKIINSEYGIIGSDEKGFPNEVDYSNRWASVMDAKGRVVGENETVDWLDETNLEQDVAWAQSTLYGLLGTPEYEDARDDIRRAWLTRIEPLWFEVAGDERKENIVKLATFAALGTASGNWPWTDPQEQEEK